MTLETICLLIFVLGFSLSVFLPERLIIVAGAVAGLLWSLIIIIHTLK